MMRLCVIYLIIAVLKIESVKTQNAAKLSSYDSSFITPYNFEPNKCSSEILYAMIAIIILLCLVIIALVVYICKLKKKDSEYDDTLDIMETDATCKYARQLSSETTNATFTRENSQEDPRIKLTRTGSRMSIVTFPENTEINQVNNTSKRREPLSSTSTLNKTIYHQPPQMQKDQIRKICEAVLEKSQNKSIYSSLSNLDKIISEGKTKQSHNAEEKDKSASSGLLDIVDNEDTSPSPVSVKKAINYFQDLPTTPILTKKNMNINEKKQPIVKNNGGNAKDMPNNYSSLMKSDAEKTVESVTEDDIYDNPPQGIKPVCLNENDSELLDDIYIDAPSNIPVIFKSDDDEIYDNIPTNRPITVNDDNIYDICDNPLSNKPITNIDVDHPGTYVDLMDNKPNYATVMKDTFPDNFKFEKFDTNKTASDQNLKDTDIQSNTSKRVISVNDEVTNYVLTLTSDEDPCFETNYVNAKSYKC